MNKAKWNALPKDIQDIIEKINVEWIEKQGKLWDEIDQEGREYMKQRGNQFIALSKEEEARWIEKVKPVIADQVKPINAKGLPGDAALKFCQDYLKANQK
jgi:TRAP-type C4-dicarboxylate transport system substrate-binding protein